MFYKNSQTNSSKNSFYYTKILKLSSPIFIDNLLRILVPLLTSILVIEISSEAMAIIVVANVIIILAFSMLECFAQASIPIISQCVGSKDWKKLRVSIYSVLILSIIFGLVLCFYFLLFPELFVSFITKDPVIIDFASKYIRIIGCGLPFYSLSYSCICVLNSYSKTHIPMIYSFIVNLLAISVLIIMYFFKHSSYTILYYIAFTHLLSRILGLSFLLVSVKRLNISNGISLYSNFNLRLIAKEVFIFLPFALTNTVEAISYHFGQILLSKVIAELGASSLALQGYVFNVNSLLGILPLSISKGTQILVGKCLGIDLLSKANTKLMKSIVLTLMMTTIPLYFVYTFSNTITNFYIRDVAYSNVYKKLLAISITITILKCLSFNFSAAIKAAGDIKFLVTMTTLLSLFFTVPISYLLIKYLESNLIIIWYVFWGEECIKVFFLFNRWCKKRWTKYLLVRQ